MLAELSLHAAAVLLVLAHLMGLSEAGLPGYCSRLDFEDADGKALLPPDTSVALQGGCDGEEEDLGLFL